MSFSTGADVLCLGRTLRSQDGTSNTECNILDQQVNLITLCNMLCAYGISACHIPKQIAFNVRLCQKLRRHGNLDDDVSSHTRLLRTTQLKMLRALVQAMSKIETDSSSPSSSVYHGSISDCMKDDDAIQLWVWVHSIDGFGM